MPPGWYAMSPRHHFHRDNIPSRQDSYGPEQAPHIHKDLEVPRDAPSSGLSRKHEQLRFWFVAIVRLIKQGLAWMDQRFALLNNRHNAISGSHLLCVGFQSLV